MPLLREAAEALNAATQRWPDKTELTVAYVNLGVYANEKGNADLAREFLTTASALADRQGLGQHHLYVADLASKLGQEDRSIAIQRKLLEGRCLPAVRILPLLTKLAATDPTAAKQLGNDAIRYCSEPRLQQWVTGSTN